MSILVVDDDIRLNEMITEIFTIEGFDVVNAFNGEEAIDVLAADKSIELVILDVMMPELDGFSACREIRKSSNVPIIMLSARGEEYDRINGFELGVDDYVVKPFSPKELMLRINAIMKRSAGTESKNEIIEIEGLVADITARTVTIDGKRVEMSPKEYDLFFYMLHNRNIALTREKLITEVWGYDFYGDDRTLDTHIKLLRKSLGKYSKLIVTLRGVGYRFE